MKDSIELLLVSLETLSKDSRIVELRVIEKTKSLLKARLYFSEDIYAQIYVNIRRPKKSYALVINDTRIFGRDFIFGAWHTHPFEDPKLHEASDKVGKPMTVNEFIGEVLFIMSEKMKII